MTEIKQLTRPVSKIDLWIAVLVWLIAFSLYVRTLAPSLLWDDSAEFQTLSYTLGMTHSTGYMTYILIGKLFTLIPVGNIAYRVNLMSAFFGALAVAQIFLIVRVLGSQRTAALTASLLLGLTEGFWRRAVIAELYAPAASMIASIWLFILLWNRSGKWGYLFAAGMLGGLSVGIHSTIVMTAASVLIYMAISARTKSAWLGAAAGALLGLALTTTAFLFVDANDPPSSIYNTVYRPSLSVYGLTASDFDTPFERLFAIFPASHFWTNYFTATPEIMRARLAEYVLFFPWWEAGLIVAGMAAVFFHSRWYDGLYPVVAFPLIWGLGVTVAFSSYQDFYAVSMVFVSVWLGLGAGTLLDGLDALVKWKPARNRMMRTVILSAASLTLILLPIWNARMDVRLAIEKGYTSFILRDHLYPILAPDSAIRNARIILKHVETNAILFSTWDKLYSFVYTAEIAMGRTDVNFHEADPTDSRHLSESILAYINANIDTRPIYFTVLLDELNELYLVEQIEDSLYRIRRQ